MVFAKNINNLHFDSISEMLLHNPHAFFQILDSLIERKIPAGETGVDRKLLYSWKKQNIIPFTENIGWERFSFIDLCWIRMVVEFRNVGLSIEKIKELKEFFYDDNFFHQVFDNTPIKWELLEKETAKTTKEKLKIGSNDILNVNHEIIEAFSKIQFSKFMIIVLLTFMKKANMCFCFDDNGNSDCFDLNNIINESIETFPKILDLISEKSIVIINIRKVITEIIENKDYFNQDPQLTNLINEQSIEYLKRLFIENKVKEVTIRISEKGVATASIKKEMDLVEMQKEIYDLRKKGIFKDVIIKTRNGNIQYFEETELIKL